jgi:hypothetical protein
MSRRILLALVLLTLLAALGTAQLAQAATQLDAPTMKRALRVTEQENNGFVERVVELMNEGKLSRKDVTAAFLKARQRTRHKFQYFKYAMTHLANRAGVSLTESHNGGNNQQTQRSWWQRFWSFLLGS